MKNFEELLSGIEKNPAVIIFFNGFRASYEGYIVGREEGKIILSDKRSNGRESMPGETPRAKRTFAEISVQGLPPYSGFKGPDWRFRDIKGDFNEDPSKREYEQKVGYLVLDCEFSGSD